MPIKSGVVDHLFPAGQPSSKKSKRISEKGPELKDMTYEVVVYCENVIKYVYYHVPFCNIGKLLLSRRLCDKAHIIINEEDERSSYTN
jgi:hypothetical protein